MNDRELYETLLGLGAPWVVVDVAVDLKENQVTVRVAAAEGTRFACAECGAEVTQHDTRSRSWRHLDTMQFNTILECDVPRCRCEKHGVHQVKVPWAEDRSRFTALFERLVIDLLKIATVKAVANRLSLTWDEVDGIQARAVERGIERKKLVPPKQMCVDETSFQKRHEYVTVVANLESGAVEFVTDGNSKESLAEYFQLFDEKELEEIELVTMDMWQAYIEATKDHLIDADKKIAFDKFHVAQHLGKAVDKVRRGENAELLKKGDSRLVGTKHWWLYQYAHVLELRPSWHLTFEELRRSTLRVARAWSLKETAMKVWEYTSRGWARRVWNQWLAWASRSRLEPMKDVGRMIASHLGGIINAMVNQATNAMAESINAKIQKIKADACGFRNRERFRNAIYFHLGALDLYPRPSGTHTVS